MLCLRRGGGREEWRGWGGREREGGGGGAERFLARAREKYCGLVMRNIAYCTSSFATCLNMKYAENAGKQKEMVKDKQKQHKKMHKAMKKQQQKKR